MFNPNTPQGVANLRAIWYAVWGFFVTIGVAYLGLNATVPGMAEGEKWKLAIVTAVAGAAVPTGIRSIEGSRDQARAEAGRVEPGDVGQAAERLGAI